MIVFSGFADEAGGDIQSQIKATLEIGWKNIDLRFINGKNATDISDEEFDKVVAALESAGISVPCFGSAVGNAGKDFLSETDVAYCFAALERAFPRMKRLGTKFIRGMAFSYHKELSLEENEKIIFPLMEKIVKRCEEEGVTFLCENCGGYSGRNYENLARLSAHLNSENFKVVYDTGNPIGELNAVGQPPYEKQKSYDFYLAMKPYTTYIHIKDQLINEEGKCVRTFPGEGDADVVEVVRDLIKTGYSGYVTIEPHLYNGYEGYVEYGRRTMALFEEASK